ncbi:MULTISPECIES: DNA-deoxyinosine glycosylase [unclassified Sphingomonas]|uniref:DNA-deoxyinosine glycosylase n=1 Tax=unclassified Sphingomonas TaxID=196159 RepID=UPI0006F7147F|nr:MULTISPECIES: DNA-deoxyinosine glycosylase [unclassified Sphingomonas]KQX17842.1 DNA-deoxyinosine glycosylase [Sphingomonas sp. Root1294]KQY70768.1 DNA-deoxyinosine glycosylase [Sphingomonas sp. Root50]KRB91739.1 DNA-deoxyinosine glycosylase [Sphingomonas sp. Root720]
MTGPRTPSEARKSSFPPVVSADTRLLLLGSLPGEASLRAERYYAHPQNQFWRLTGALVGDEDFHLLDYQARLARLLASGVGLWDVVADAVRDGSLDAAIRDHRPNDLAALVASLPSLRAIGFNGGTAARLGRRMIGAPQGIALVDLPSSSPAFTRSLAEKREKWVGLRGFLEPIAEFRRD